MMKNIASMLIVATLLLSCKAKQKAVETIPVVTPVANETTNNIIANHRALTANFKTALIKADVDYKDARQSLSVSADIRIKKDEVILVTIKMFGFTGAKALITPKEVKYYEKVSGKYFEGDYQMLSDWLGTELNFQKVQNMLLGRAVDDLALKKYDFSMEDNAPKLDEVTDGNIATSFVFDPNLFVLKKQEIKQIQPDRKMVVQYNTIQSYPECILPMELAIFAIQGQKTTSIAIQNKHISFNEKMNFPYNVPNGYEQIKIK